MALFKIEDYQLRELHEGQLYINIYDCSVMYSYELAKYAKEFYYDVLNELSKKVGLHVEGSLPIQLEDYLKIIKKYNLKICIEDYPELCDYILLDDWIVKDGNHIIHKNRGIYLSSE